MKLKIVVPLVSVIVLVAVGACGWAYMNAQSQADAERESNMAVMDAGRNPRTKIVKIVKDVAKGQTIAPDDLEEAEIPNEKVPESALSSASLAAGRVAAVDISQGTVLLAGHLAAQIASPPSSESTSESSATTAAKPHKKYGKHK